MLETAAKGAPGVPQFLDGPCDDARVAHLEHDDDGDRALKEGVEQQDEEGPERDDAAHPKVGSTKEERTFPRGFRELARFHLATAKLTDIEEWAALARLRVRLGTNICLRLGSRRFGCSRPNRKDEVLRCNLFSHGDAAGWRIDAAGQSLHLRDSLLQRVMPRSQLSDLESERCNVILGRLLRLLEAVVLGSQGIELALDIGSQLVEVASQYVKRQVQMGGRARIGHSGRSPFGRRFTVRRILPAKGFESPGASICL
jgi:hypothetical protein